MYGKKLHFRPLQVIVLVSEHSQITFSTPLLKNEAEPDHCHMVPGLKENPSISELAIKITRGDNTGNATFKLSKICLFVFNVFCSEGEEDFIRAWKLPQVEATATGHCISAWKDIESFVFPPSRHRCLFFFFFFLTQYLIQTQRKGTATWGNSGRIWAQS